MKRSKLLALSLACGAGLLVPRAALLASPVLSYTGSSDPVAAGWTYEGTAGAGYVAPSGPNPGYLISTTSPANANTAWVSPEFAVIPGDYYQTTYMYLDQQTSIGSKGYVATFGANPAATYDLEQTNNAEYWRTAGSGQNISNGSPLYAGQLLHDDYTGMLPTGSSFTTNSTVWQAPQNAADGFVVFQGASATAPLEVQSMNVTQISSTAALAWTSGLKTALNFQTTPSFNLPAGRFAQLPHTFAKLASGQHLKIAMMTDSIVCDDENSLFSTMVEHDYPGSSITLYNATGHGTSTTNWYNTATGTSSVTGGLNLQQAVINQNPDLVIIGGVSSMGMNLSNQSIKDFHNLTVELRAANPNVDILYITGDDWDQLPSQVHDYTASGSNASYPTGNYSSYTFNRPDTSPPLISGANNNNDYRLILAQQAAIDGVGFFDTYGERGNYLENELHAEDGPNPTEAQQAAFFDELHRDTTHSNDYGKNIDAQVLEAYFDGASTVPEPASLALIGVGSLSLLARRRRRLRSPNRQGVCTTGHEAS